MTHYLTTPLPKQFGPGAHVRLAHDPDGIALFFLHGFNGGASTTWTDFPGMLCRSPKVKNSDIYFLSYDSLRTRATISAALIRNLVGTIWSNPARFTNNFLVRSAARPATFKYRKCYFIAHSLGSVVARQAMIDGLSASPPDDWVSQARLVLFAPAHKGADVMTLAVECLAGIPAVGRYLASLAAIMRFKFPVLQDLEQHSATLVQLETVANKLMSSGCQQLKAMSVIWGEKDRVVVPLTFGQDPPPNVIRGKGHVSVCKPTTDDTRPFDLLEKTL